MIIVTCAIIRNEENEILVVQRGEKSDHPLKWEFPGGKLKEGETSEECIIREIREELSMELIICRQLQDVEYDYGIKQVKLIPFVCDSLDELPVLSEHLAFKWLTPGRLMEIDFAGADVIVARNYLQETGADDCKDITDNGPDRDPAAEADLRSVVREIRSSAEAGWIAKSAFENQRILSMLLDFSFTDDKKLASHASWVISKLCEEYPETVKPHLSGVVKKLDGINDESVRRSVLRIISLSDINIFSQHDQGVLADYCFNQLKSGYSSIGVKAYSMEILGKLAVLYPELANELAATIVLLQGEGSAGIKAKGTIVLKKLAGLSQAPGSSQK
ncbi:MAG: (deoxy)nucleoside triphosphate pyrophosphohydrolase [Bacteroidales bacterium]